VDGFSLDDRRSARDGRPEHRRRRHEGRRHHAYEAAQTPGRRAALLPLTLTALRRHHAPFARSLVGATDLANAGTARAHERCRIAPPGRGQAAGQLHTWHDWNHTSKRRCTYDCYGQSFVDSFKTELIAGRVWLTRSLLELAIVEYISWFKRQPTA
jgi:Integrase core domain